MSSSRHFSQANYLLEDKQTCGGSVKHLFLRSWVLEAATKNITDYISKICCFKGKCLICEKLSNDVFNCFDSFWVIG